MDKNYKKLQIFQKWFSKYIRQNYGPKCLDFAWGCPACHAHFVKDIFSDFVWESESTEKWLKKQNKKSKSQKSRR